MLEHATFFVRISRDSLVDLRATFDSIYRESKTIRIVRYHHLNEHPSKSDPKELKLRTSKGVVVVPSS